MQHYVFPEDKPADFADVMIWMRGSRSWVKENPIDLETGDVWKHADTPTPETLARAKKARGEG